MSVGFCETCSHMFNLQFHPDRIQYTPGYENSLHFSPRFQQYAERLANGSVEFHRLRQRHPGIESAIGALQSGNGLKRCRDRSEVGFERYLGLAILGRNIHVLGKLLIARRQEQSAAALSKRKAA